MKITQTANGVSIETRTKFFQAANGEYFLAFYFVEDDIIHRQNTYNGYDANYDHDHVFRGVLTDDPVNPSITGEMIASGSITAGTDYKKTFTYTHEYATYFTLPTDLQGTIEPWDWNAANTSVIAVIWKKDGSDYTLCKR